MNKKDLDIIIKETILEMLKEGNETVIKMMIQHESKFEKLTESKEEFVNNKIKLLKEELGIVDDLDEDQPEILSEQKKMMELAGIITESRGKLEGWSNAMFGSIQIGEEFKMEDDPDDAILIKVSKTHYKVATKGHPASGVKFDAKPKDKVYTKKG